MVILWCWATFRYESGNQRVKVGVTPFSIPPSDSLGYFVLPDPTILDSIGLNIWFPGNEWGYSKHFTNPKLTAPTRLFGVPHANAPTNNELLYCQRYLTLNIMRILVVAAWGSQREYYLEIKGFAGTHSLVLPCPEDACVLQQTWPGKGVTRSSVVSEVKFQLHYQSYNLAEVLVQDKEDLEYVV